MKGSKDMASSIQKFDFEHMTTAIADQVKAKLATKQDTLQLDASPTQNSAKFVNSGAVYQAIENSKELKFIGTKAEWNALTIEEKAVYDGKLVYITDDTSSGGGSSTGGGALFIDEDGYICVDYTNIPGGSSGGDTPTPPEPTHTTYTINITTSEPTLYGKTVTAIYGSDSETATISNEGLATIELIDYTGEVTISASDGSKTASETVTIAEGTTTYSAELTLPTLIYGVSWDGGSSSAMTRTDASALFADPVPAVNNGDGSSPFDTCYPWNGMEIVNDGTAGSLVSIPKYYYKWTKTGSAMTLQIADSPADGFLCSPAHADRGDGKGERDVVYVGRYHCATSTYKSTTGVKPMASKTRAEFRTAIHNLGSDIWQYDFAMFWTINMLYLVEYADWNSQKKIGYGCGNNSATENAGLTDAMTYHTGTNASSRTTYGHIQYRHIEDLWANVFDWCDGIYFSGADVYCIKNPSNFSDTTGGTKTGTRPTDSNDIKAWSIPSAAGFEYALYPSEVVSDSNYETYICDYCDYGASGVVLRVGGFYGQVQDYGAFFLYGSNAATSKSAFIGSRLQKLPASAS